jgi:hypothetical protein
MILTLRACSVFALAAIAAGALVSCGHADKVQAKAGAESSSDEIPVGVVKNACTLPQAHAASPRLLSRRVSKIRTDRAIRSISKRW